MASKIFLNYRRGDDPGNTGRLYDRLEPEFGGENLFMDVEGHIKGGDDFVDILKSHVAACDVLLAIIGPRWLNIADDEGRRRLDNPDDWVRVEIVGALETGKRVIPVLVGGADMPHAEDLPEPLQQLARRQAIRITLERFKADAQGLVTQIKSTLAEVERARMAATEAERAAVAKADAQRRAEDEARAVERARQEAEQARQEAVSGWSEAQIRQVLEAGNWAFVREKTDPADFRDHIARFSGGTTEPQALRRLASLEWAVLGDAPDKAALQVFLGEFPNSPEANKANSLLSAIERREAAENVEEQRLKKEEAEWARVSASNDSSALQAFLRNWPNGLYCKPARMRLRELKAIPRRRFLLRGLWWSAGLTVSSGALYVGLRPGAPIWRALYDNSLFSFKGNNHFITLAFFGKDSHTINTVGIRFRVWSAGSGDLLSSFNLAASSYSISYNKNRNRIAFSDYRDKGLIRVYDISSGQEVISLKVEDRPIYQVAISPDGNCIAASFYDSSIRIWSIKENSKKHLFHGVECPTKADTWDCSPTSPIFSPDGTAIATLSAGRQSALILDTSSGATISTLLGHLDKMTSVSFSPDSAYILTTSKDKTAKIWNVKSGECKVTLSGHEESIDEALYSPDGKRLLTWSWLEHKKTTGILWDSETGLQIGIIRMEISQPIVVFSPDSKIIATGGNLFEQDYSISLWDLYTQKVFAVLSGHTSMILSIEFSPDGKLVAATALMGEAKVWAVPR